MSGCCPRYPKCNHPFPPLTYEQFAKQMEAIGNWSRVTEEGPEMTHYANQHNANQHSTDKDSQIGVTHLLANDKRCAGQSLDSSANNVRLNLQEDHATTCRPVEPESVRHNSTFQGVVEPESVGLNSLKVDELLDRLSCACCASPQELALRAVVEINCPVLKPEGVTWTHEHEIYVKGLNDQASMTIQEIEENLK